MENSSTIWNRPYQANNRSNNQTYMVRRTKGRRNQGRGRKRGEKMDGKEEG
uniref:Uncharacterized protein n=1 Tax=Triticum urartu TaxID=4572 RepID=A0A8R7QJP0_TRIUA